MHIAALVALHDLGKFTRSLVAELWPAVLGPFVMPPQFPHDTAGYWLLRDLPRSTTVGLFDGWNAGHRAAI